MKSERDEVTTRELKDKLEAAVGQELAVDAVAHLGFTRTPVGLYDITSTPEGSSFVTSRGLIRVLPKICVATRILDVSGWGIMGSDGQRTFRLSEFFCYTATLGVTLEAPINVIATPNTRVPCFLTSQYSLVDDHKDVEITLSAWDPNGAAAPDISFDWRCRVAWSEPSIL